MVLLQNLSIDEFGHLVYEDDGLRFPPTDGTKDPKPSELEEEENGRSKTTNTSAKAEEDDTQ